VQEVWGSSFFLYMFHITRNWHAFTQFSCPLKMFKSLFYSYQHVWNTECENVPLSWKTIDTKKVTNLFYTLTLLFMSLGFNYACVLWFIFSHLADLCFIKYEMFWNVWYKFFVLIEGCWHEGVTDQQCLWFFTSNGSSHWLAISLPVSTLSYEWKSRSKVQRLKLLTFWSFSSNP
jgi:hypothetical protein